MSCQCNATLKNTGTPSCPSIMKIAKKLILVPEFDANGDKNVLTVADAKVLANWSAKLTAAELKDRFYPAFEMVNVEDLRGDAVFEEHSDGSRSLVRAGSRSFTGFGIRLGAEYTGLIDGWRNQRFGVYIVDKDGNIIYQECNATDANPIMVDNTSWEARLVKSTDSEVEKTMITFNFRETEKDEKLRVIPVDDLDFDPFVELKGLVDAAVTYTSITTTSFTATIVDDFGCPIEGMLLADFSLAETSPTPGSVSISTVTESAAGVYDFTFPAETSGDVLALTPSEAGYDWAAVTATDITIP